MYIQTLEHIRIDIHYRDTVFTYRIPDIIQILAFLCIQNNKTCADYQCIIDLCHRPCKAEADHAECFIVLSHAAHDLISFE